MRFRGLMIIPLTAVLAVLSVVPAYGRVAEHNTVETADPLDVAARMVASLQHERLPFHALYLKWKFAFPGAVCPLLEGADRTRPSDS